MSWISEQLLLNVQVKIIDNAIPKRMNIEFFFRITWTTTKYKFTSRAKQQMDRKNINYTNNYTKNTR